MPIMIIALRHWRAIIIQQCINRVVFQFLGTVSNTYSMRAVHSAMVYRPRETHPLAHFESH